MRNNPQRFEQFFLSEGCLTKTSVDEERVGVPHVVLVLIRLSKVRRSATATGERGLGSDPGREPIQERGKKNRPS